MNLYFEQLISNSSVWIEIRTLKEANYYFTLHEEKAIGQVTLYDQSRNMYVELSSTDARTSYSLSQTFNVLYAGGWMNKSKQENHKFHLALILLINLFIIKKHQQIFGRTRIKIIFLNN